MAQIIYALVPYGVAYQKKNERDFAEQHRQRMEKNLRRRAKERGYGRKKIEDLPAEPEYPMPAYVVVLRFE